MSPEMKLALLVAGLGFAGASLPVLLGFWRWRVERAEQKVQAQASAQADRGDAAQSLSEAAAQLVEPLSKRIAQLEVDVQKARDELRVALAEIAQLTVEKDQLARDLHTARLDADLLGVQLAEMKNKYMAEQLKTERLARENAALKAGKPPGN